MKQIQVLYRYLSYILHNRPETKALLSEIKAGIPHSIQYNTLMVCNSSK